MAEIGEAWNQTEDNITAGSLKRMTHAINELETIFRQVPDIGLPLHAVYKLVWSGFYAWYLEMVK